MPELPEVETIARELRARLRGKKIADFCVLREDYVRFSSSCRNPRGKKVADVRRHGKRIHIELVPQGEILFHLGMSGTITLESAQSPSRNHTHLRVSFVSSELELRVRDPRRFGGVWLREKLQGSWPKGRRAPGDLGPDALSIRLREFRELLARPRQIKALLLDQAALAGLGNIYCDEALFASRIHPAERAAELDARRVASLLKCIRRVLRQAIRHKGTTLRDYRTPGGGEGSFQRRHRVYGREGKPCTRCGTPVARILLAGRSTHFCARCQRK